MGFSHASFASSAALSAKTSSSMRAAAHLESLDDVGDAPLPTGECAHEVAEVSMLCLAQLHRCRREALQVFPARLRRRREFDSALRQSRQRRFSFPSVSRRGPMRPPP
eukprot:6187144-Pleurochrysis_carterae.AAC.1